MKERILNNGPVVVTIWCLAYNQENYIRRCLEGFVMQKTNFKYEAIIHDDASTDGTAAIIKEYQKLYPDVIVPIIEEENQYSQHNGETDRIMMNHTHGKYIAICEGDDYWIDPFKLQKQVDFLESHPSYTMCVHAAIEFYQDCSQLPFVFPSIKVSQDLDLDQILNDWVIPTASILVRNDVFPMPEWAAKIYSGDMTLALMAYSKGKVFFMNDVMSFYRKHKAGVSSTSINPPDYVCHQKAALYDYYNKETNYKYVDVLNKKVDFYRKYAKFWEYRKKGLLYAIVRMPIFAFSKLIKRK